MWLALGGQPPAAHAAHVWLVGLTWDRRAPHSLPSFTELGVNCCTPSLPPRWSRAAHPASPAGPHQCHRRLCSRLRACRPHAAASGHSQLQRQR